VWEVEKKAARKNNEKNLPMLVFFNISASKEKKLYMNEIE
jgi:hypothetical protein